MSWWHADGGAGDLTEEDLLAALPMELLAGGGAGGVPYDDEYVDFEEEEDPDEEGDDDEADGGGDGRGQPAGGAVGVPAGRSGMYEVTEDGTLRALVASEAAHARYDPLWQCQNPSHCPSS